jgi:hypothetical protein
MGVEVVLSVRTNFNVGIEGAISFSRVTSSLSRVFHALLNILRVFLVGPCCCSAFCRIPTSQEGVSKDILTWVEIQPLTFHVPFSFDYVYFVDLLVHF